MYQIFVVYKTDAHHSYASRDIIALCTTADNVILICKAQAKKEGAKISADQLWNLINLKQTQGYSGPGEFQYEKMSINTLL